MFLGRGLGYPKPQMQALLYTPLATNASVSAQAGKVEAGHLGIGMLHEVASWVQLAEGH